MPRLQACSATFVLLVLACSSARDDEFFKASDSEVAGGGTGSIDLSVGATSTVGSVDGSSLDPGDASGEPTTSGGTGTDSGGSGAQGTGGSPSATTNGASTSDGAGASGGSSAGGEGTGGANTGVAGAGGSGTGGASTGGASTGGASTGGTSAGGSGTGGDSGGTAGAGAGGSGGCSVSDEICDGLDNDCDEDTDEDDVCPTGCFGDTYQGSTYLFCDRPPGQSGFDSRPARSWQQAMQYCLARDQVLVNIQTSAESDFVYAGLDELGGSGDIWMGATDQEQEDLWSWALGMNTTSWEVFYDDDSEMVVDDAFIDWRSGEPNDQGSEDCGVIEVQEEGGYLWDDRSCQTTFDRFVCEDAP